MNPRAGDDRANPRGEGGSRSSLALRPHPHLRSSLFACETRANPAHQPTHGPLGRAPPGSHPRQVGLHFPLLGLHRRLYCTRPLRLLPPPPLRLLAASRLLTAAVAFFASWGLSAFHRSIFS